MKQIWTLITLISLLAVEIASAVPAYIRIRNDTSVSCLMASIECLHGIQQTHVFVGDVKPGRVSGAVRFVTGTGSVTFHAIIGNQKVSYSFHDVANHPDGIVMLELALQDKTHHPVAKLDGDFEVLSMRIEASPSIFFDADTSKALNYAGAQQSLQRLFRSIRMPQAYARGYQGSSFVLGYQYGVLASQIRYPVLKWETVLFITESIWRPMASNEGDPFAIAEDPNRKLKDQVHEAFKSGFELGYQPPKETTKEPGASSNPKEPIEAKPAPTKP